MSSEFLLGALKSLKLHGMAQAVDELARQGAAAFSTIKPMLNTLVEAERAEREVRSINYQMRAARFPAYRDLCGFHFNEAPPMRRCSTPCIDVTSSPMPTTS